MTFETVSEASNWFRLKLSLPYLRARRSAHHLAGPERPKCSLDHPADLKLVRADQPPVEQARPVGFSRAHQPHATTSPCRASPPRNALRPFWLRDRSSQI